MININIKSTNFNMTPDIEGLINDKMMSAEKFLEVTDESQEYVLVEYEVERLTHHKKGDVFRAEANLTFKGNLYRSEAKAGDIRTAIDDVQNQLEKRIRRNKTKKESMFMKGARRIKSMIRRNNE